MRGESEATATDTGEADTEIPVDSQPDTEDADTGDDSGTADTSDSAEEDTGLRTISEFTSSVVYSPSEGDALGTDIVCVTPTAADGGSPALVAGAQYASPTDGGAYEVPLTGEPEISTRDADGHTIGVMHFGIDGRIRCAGDTDGDGQNEIAMTSEPVDYDGQPFIGAVYELPLDGEEAWEDAEFTVWARFEDSGSSASIDVGDVDGDGIPELGLGSANVGSPEDDPHDPDGGVAFIRRGDSSSVLIDDADYVVGHWRASRMSVPITIEGDLTGDGYDDVIAFHPSYETDTIYGRIDIIPGPLPASGVVDDLATVTIFGETDAGWYNLWIDSNHQADIDGDGSSDLSFTAYRGTVYPNEEGFFYLPGPLSGTYTPSDAPGGMIVWADEFQSQYHDLADLDGDGAIDGIWTDELSDVGATLGGALSIAWGPLLGFTTAPDTTLYGDKIWAMAGSSLDTYDIDDDGAADLIVGAEGDRTWAYGGGSVSILLGKDLRALKP